MSLAVLFLSVIAGVSFGFMLLFYLRSERMHDKLMRTEDIVFSLANKKGLFTKKESIMREDEKAPFHLLEEAVGEKYYVFPQVHLSELIDVASGNKDHDNLYIQLGAKHVDFAVFDREHISPKAVIELNGEYHFRTSQKNKDETRKALFASVGIGFIVMTKADAYTLDSVKTHILPYLTT